MSKAIRTVYQNETFSLTECSDGYWLYDEIQGQNISMRAENEQSAHIESIQYYQKKCRKLENNYIELNKKVQSFLDQFCEDD